MMKIRILKGLSKLNRELCILALCCLLIVPLHAAQPTVDDLQSVMIHKVIQLTEWPNETSKKHINIGVFGSSSSYISMLKNRYQNRDIRNKKLVISRFDPFSSKDDIQVLIIKNSHNQDLKPLSEQLKNRNILLISEDSNDKKYLMVNLFSTTEGNLGFEINRSNIILANLKISKDIVLAGGTELDVAEIFDQAVTDLSDTKEELNLKKIEIQQQSLLLAQQQIRIKELDKSIWDQQAKLAQQNKSIANKNTELNSKELKLKELKTELATQINIINNSTDALERIEDNLKTSSQSLAKQEVKNLTLTEKIESNLELLEQQKASLKEKEDELNDKNIQLSQADKTVSQQESTIQTQKNLLTASILIAILFFSLMIALYRIFVAKKKASSLLEKKNRQLEQAMSNLHLAQEQLIESEKMASLGGMVAGIAHEVNTPAGIVLTADTSLLENTKLLQQQIANGTMTKADLIEYLDYSIECNNISVENIKRVASLIKTFKQVAVDQSNNEFLEFNLAAYIDEILASLQYLFEDNEHEISVQIEDSIILKSYPTVYFQLINTLISNSLIHGFENIKHGRIELTFTSQNDTLFFSYKDNGKGASKEVINKIFDPFYTTKRGAGSSGLGTHILYNMVTQLLKGKVSCQQNRPHGLIFDFELPLQLYSQSNQPTYFESKYKKAATHSHG